MPPAASTGGSVAGPGERTAEVIALSYSDNAGISRAKLIRSADLDAASERGIGMSPVFDAFLSDDEIITTPDAGGPVGDLRLHPDSSRVRLLPQPGLALAPVDRRRADGSPHPQCHRDFVRRMSRRAADEGLAFTMGFELEWVVGRPEGDSFVPATGGPAYGLTRASELGEYLVELVAALERAGVDCEQLHPEYAPGQLEVSLPPSDPLGAADDVVLAQEIVRGVGLSHGLMTSFSPVVWTGGVGNGRHCHVSVRRGTEHLLAGGAGPRGLSQDGEGFVAGVLEALPALVGLGAASPLSAARLAPGHWSGPFVCWGHENREAALRLVTATRAGGDPSANVEWKNPDATASPYLVAGAIVAVGIDGIRRQLPLPPEVERDPSTSGTDRDGLPPGCVAPFPTRTGAALDALEASEVLAEALGGPLHRTALAVRRAELDKTDGATAEELVAAYRFRY